MLKICSFLLLLMTTGVSPDDNPAPKIFPVPPTNENSLFYLQRSKNTNAIIYEVNRKEDGNLDPLNPINIFWIRYATDSTKEDLSYIQSKYAYGLTIRPYNGQKNAFVIHFVSYDKKNFFLLPTATPKKYAVFTNIDGKMAELKKIFIKLNGGTFWFPTIEYVEMTGKDPANQQNVAEHFLPKR